jgi:hypothetical protein
VIFTSEASLREKRCFLLSNVSNNPEINCSQNSLKSTLDTEWGNKIPFPSGISKTNIFALILKDPSYNFFGFRSIVHLKDALRRINKNKKVNNRLIRAAYDPCYITWTKGY